jgi:endonuclease/exonuclease/phosphatase family metal-dependent hydrolase
VNVHLSPHSARATRAHELRTVGRLLGSGGPAIVAGDLNDLPDSPLAAQLRGVGLRDAWSVAHPEPEVPGGAGVAAPGVPDGSDRPARPEAAAVPGVAGPGGAPRPGRSVGGATNWSGVGRAGPPNQRIDHVWLSPGIEVVAGHVPAYGDAGFERYPPLSDHLPLTVTLEVPHERLAK